MRVDLITRHHFSDPFVATEDLSLPWKAFDANTEASAPNNPMQAAKQGELRECQRSIRALDQARSLSLSEQTTRAQAQHLAAQAAAQQQAAAAAAGPRHLGQRAEAQAQQQRSVQQPVSCRLPPCSSAARPPDSNMSNNQMSKYSDGSLRLDSKVFETTVMSVPE